MYQRILVGTDGSDTAAQAVTRAVQVAASTGASLTILSAGRPARASQIVAEAKGAHASSPVAIDTRVVDGDPATALATVAEDEGYDLVVVGNKGMTGLTRFFKVGAVPNKLSHAMPTSLLVVRTT